MTTPFPPRLLLDVDGRAVCARVHTPTCGTDPTKPPVVLAAGGAGQGIDGEWGPDLEALLAEHFVVLTYDRAGSGRSDGPPHATVAEMAHDLDEVLRAAGVSPPVILAGWSLGGFVALGYALSYPEHVAGLVFIDPTPIEAPPSSLAMRVQHAVIGPVMGAVALAASTGLFSGRLGRGLAHLMASADPTPETEAQALGLLRSSNALRALADVTRRVPKYASELEDALAMHGLPDVPAAVMTAGRRPGFPAEYVENIEASHLRLLKRFPRGRAVTVEQASHQMPLEDHAIVADTIRAIADSAAEK